MLVDLQCSLRFCACSLREFLQTEADREGQEFTVLIIQWLYLCQRTMCLFVPWTFFLFFFFLYCFGLSLGVSNFSFSHRLIPHLEIASLKASRTGPSLLEKVGNLSFSLELLWCVFTVAARPRVAALFSWLGAVDALTYSRGFFLGVLFNHHC